MYFKQGEAQVGTSPPGAIGRALSARRTKPRYVVLASARGILLLRRLLTDRAFDAVVTRFYGP